MRLTQVLQPLSFVKFWLMSVMIAVMMPYNIASADNAFTGLRMGSVAIDGADATRLVVEMSKPIEARFSFWIILIGSSWMWPGLSGMQGLCCQWGL